MSDYVIVNDELYHYGVPGMKWGVHKAQKAGTAYQSSGTKKYIKKAKTARESAKEWNEIGRAKAAKYEAKGKIDKANKIKSKYDFNAKTDRYAAKRFEEKAARCRQKDKFREKRVNASDSRSKGAKAATFLLAGPMANKTYASVIAAGGTKTGARVVTALASAGGPLGHVAVSALYTKGYADRKTVAGRR